MHLLLIQMNLIIVFQLVTRFSMKKVFVIWKWTWEESAEDIEQAI